jgi:predicted kinase
MKRDRTRSRRIRLKAWRSVLVIADQCIAEDLRQGKSTKEMRKVRRSVMRRINRLARQLNAGRSAVFLRHRVNSLHPLDNRPHNGVNSGARNG